MSWLALGVSRRRQGDYLTRIVLDADWNHVCGAGIVCLRR
jgi:hypothetical protein